MSKLAWLWPGCIDEDTTEAIQMQEAREEIPVGGSVSGTLEEPK